MEKKALFIVQEETEKQNKTKRWEHWTMQVNN